MSEEMKLTEQAIGSLMMALQKSLMEQSDIVPVLQNFKLKLSEHGLVVMNPPIVKFDDAFEEELINSVDNIVKDTTETNA